MGAHGYPEIQGPSISSSAKTGSIGDGKVFVSALESAVRIRTGEQGDKRSDGEMALRTALNPCKRPITE